jgi:hypothetical protein
MTSAWGEVFDDILACMIVSRRSFEQVANQLGLNLVQCYLHVVRTCLKAFHTISLDKACDCMSLPTATGIGKTKAHAQLTEGTIQHVTENLRKIMSHINLDPKIAEGGYKAEDMKREARAQVRQFVSSRAKLIPTTVFPRSSCFCTILRVTTPSNMKMCGTAAIMVPGTNVDQQLFRATTNGSFWTSFFEARSSPWWTRAFWRVRGFGIG